MPAGCARGNLKVRGYLEDLSVDVNIILKVDLVDKARTGFICRQDRWLAVVNTVMNLRVPYNAGNCVSG